MVRLSRDVLVAAVNGTPPSTPSRLRPDLTAISQHLDLDRKTVRRYRDTVTPEQLTPGPRSRAFTEFPLYLRQRIQADGMTNAATLYTELRHDLDAVTNGLSLPHSSGTVEGNVTRIKTLKRSRYGCTKLDLLRRITLYSPC
ncbi:hypothetical protein AB0395_28125 [Streptosporangium sp. NPDC051023]|uniref:hypothetical protein n=1 Tax=Streptosporangium sp. NPDC051023 TaxID=3155410 RepID=UPI00344BD068